MFDIDLDFARNEICNRDKGFFKIDNFYSADEVDTYRAECEKFTRDGPVFHTRLNTSTVKDYVHPRSHDKTPRTFRIYQYLHNSGGTNRGRFFRKVLDIRDALENRWLDSDIYRSEKETMQNYIIVTSYIANTGCLPRHKDYDGPADFPLIQSLVLLSEPKRDFDGGEFILYSKSGKAWRLTDDLNLKKGDAFLFDKSLDHEVEVTRAGETDLGRWSVLIGARAIVDTPLRIALKKIIYNPICFPVALKISKVLKSR